jgi:hypothetical protein
MSARRTSQQPDANDALWGTNSQLPPRDDVERNMLPLDVSDAVCEGKCVALRLELTQDQWNRFFDTYAENVQQFLGIDVQDRTSVDSGALATGPSVIPTPLPNDVALSLGGGPELQGNVDVDLQASWESDGAIDLSTGLAEVQLENPEPSSGGSGSQQGEQRRGRRKEESGTCDLCGRWFSRKSDVKRHKNTAHAKEVHACPRCNIVCCRKDALNRHIKDQH